MRDDFSKATIDRLAKRAGYLCSNPHCRVPTIGAAPGHDGVVNVGIAAHITAAAPGGPRYDAGLASEQRRHHSNGIWLCQTDGKLVDNDEVHFSKRAEGNPVSQRFDDIRYSELLFLSSFPDGILTRGFNFANAAEAEAVRMSPLLYVDMAMTLLEELYVRLENDADQLLVSHLRGELTPRVRHGFRDDEWDNPRSTLQRFLVTGRSNHVLRITYRGLRRIEELREVLRRERVLEDFGVLLSIRYLNADLEHAVQRPDKAAVSVMCADMDGFKTVNDRFGHAEGDVVMKAYLESVRDGIGAFGDAYRGSGDEVVAIILGQGHERAVQIGEAVRRRVAALRCEYREQLLPTVSASIGIATTPPEERSRDVYVIADRRQGIAKQRGKNQVVAI